MITALFCLCHGSYNKSNTSFNSLCIPNQTVTGFCSFYVHLLTLAMDLAFHTTGVEREACAQSHIGSRSKLFSVFMPTPFVLFQDLVEALVHPLIHLEGRSPLHARSGSNPSELLHTEQLCWAVLIKYKGIWNWHWQSQELCSLNEFSVGNLIIHTVRILHIRKAVLW